MIAVVDYGAGNIFSVINALDFLGVENVLTNDPKILCEAEGLILPGVGAFPAAMYKLRESGVLDVILEESQKKPLLGICLGMQMLFEYSYEFEKTKGLGLLPGDIKLMQPSDTRLKIPHMGWNSLNILNDNPLLRDIPENSFVYFVHSYKACTEEQYIGAYADYDEQVPALVFHKNIFGAQFHPEKSGKIGLKILKNFADLCSENSPERNVHKNDNFTGN